MSVVPHKPHHANNKSEGRSAVSGRTAETAWADGSATRLSANKPASTHMRARAKPRVVAWAVAQLVASAYTAAARVRRCALWLGAVRPGVRICACTSARGEPPIECPVGFVAAWSPVLQVEAVLSPPGFAQFSLATGPTLQRIEDSSRQSVPVGALWRSQGARADLSRGRARSDPCR